MDSMPQLWIGVVLALGGILIAALGIRARRQPSGYVAFVFGIVLIVAAFGLNIIF